MIIETLRRDWRIALTHRAPFALDVLAVVVACALFYYLGRFARIGHAGNAFFAFAVAGISVLRMNAALARIVHNVSHSIADGRFELLLSEPRPAWFVVVAEAGFELLRGLLLASMSVLLAILLFGAPMHLSAAGIAGVLIGLLGALVLFAGLGLAIVAALLVFREAGALATASTILIPAIAGAYYPVGTLPAPLGEIARLLPFSACMTLIRDGMLKGRVGAIATLTLVVGAGLVASLACLLVHWSAGRARRLGTLSSL
jgi:ABC-type polysaccharide/polyol phosphate export permease